MPAALNMAWDETLLEFVSTVGRPVLRFYRWSEPAATFGYFQRYKTITRLTKLRPIVRRPTGGGLVPHDHDWTYTVVIPKAHPWYSMRAGLVYARIHQWQHLAFKLLGTQTQLALSEQDGGGRCFAGTAQFDLLFNGRKIAGAALRRTREGMLAQGSVQPDASAPTRSDWEAAVLIVGKSHFQISFESWSPDEPLASRAEHLALVKYSQPSYNEAR